VCVCVCVCVCERERGRERKRKAKQAFIEWIISRHYIVTCRGLLYAHH
jgi:hypothetical protein